MMKQVGHVFISIMASQYYCCYHVGATFASLNHCCSCPVLSPNFLIVNLIHMQLPFMNTGIVQKTKQQGDNLVFFPVPILARRLGLCTLRLFWRQYDIVHCWKRLSL